MTFVNKCLHIIPLTHAYFSIHYYITYIIESIKNSKYIIIIITTTVLKPDLLEK